MILRLATAVLLALLSFAVAADDWVDLEDRLTPEQRHATGLDTLSPEQLAALNALLRAESTAQLAKAREDAVRETGREDASAEDARGRMIGYVDGPVIARVPGTLSGWAPGFEFRLDNGQVWKVLKGEMTLRDPLQDPQVVVVPGIAGRWFLQVDEDLPKARVYRVD